MPKQQQLDRLGFLRHFRKLSQSAHLWPYDVLVIVTGKVTDDGVDYSQKKSTAFIHWLFGLFFPEVAVALTRTGMVVLTSAKKVECLRQLCAQTDGDPEVDLVTRAPGDVLDQAQLAEVWQQVVGRSRLQGSIRVGTLLQERKKGEFATSFQNALATLPRVAGVFECQEQISTVLSTKDAIELQSVRKAAGIVTALMSSVFISNLESVVDDEQQSTHKEVADTVIAALETPGRLQGVVELESAEVGELELQYVSLQSGSGVRLAPFIESTVGDLPMHGTYLLSLGLTCEEYSACIARTLLVDPVDEARQAYDLLNEVHGQVLRNLIPGMPFKDVYSAAANFVASRSTVLKSKFSDSVGFVTGIEFRDPLLVINAISPYKVEAGMTLCLSVGFSSPGPEAWAVWIADTVELQEGTDSCGVNLTAGCSILPSDVVFDTGDPAMPPGEAAEDGGDASQGAEVAEEAAPAAAADGLPAPAAAEPAPAPDAVEPAEDRPRGTANPGSGAADPAREPAGDASSAEEAGPVRKRPAARGGRGGRGRDAGRGRAGASAEDGCEASSQARGAERSPADATPPSLPKRRPRGAAAAASLGAAPAEGLPGGAADPEGEPAGGADEGRPVRKRPAAAESQADALAEGAERNPATADEAGAKAGDGSAAEEAPPTARKRPPRRASGPGRGGRSARRGRGAAGADEGEADDVPKGTKPARRRPAAASDDPGDAAASSPGAAGAKGSTPQGAGGDEAAVAKAQPLRRRASPGRGAGPAAERPQGLLAPLPKRPRQGAAARAPGSSSPDAPGRRSKRLLQADSRVREEKNDQAEQLRAEKENLRLRQALNHELKRAGPRAQASSARPPSHAGEQDAPRLDGHLSIDLAEGVLLIPLAGSILRLKLAGIESVTRTLDEGCAQLRVRFFEAGGQQEAVSEQRFRGGAAGCFDEVLSCWRSFEASRAKASLPDDSQDLGQLVVLESPPRLPGIALHPKTAAKDACALEAHTNGFRIATQSSSGGFDVLYSWVRHVFFEPPLQPDDEPSGDRLAFLHLHLKAPRALGELKKPTSDVQFRVESDAATALRAFLRGAARLAAPGLNPGLARGLQFEGQTRSQGARTSYCFYGGVLTLLNAWPHGTVVVDMSDVDVVVFEVESCAAALASMVLIMKDRERHPVRVDEIVVAEMGLLQRKLLSLKTTWLRVSGRQDWRRRVREVSRDPDKFAADGGWEALLCAILVAPDIPADAGSDAQEEAEEEGDWAHRDDQPDEDEVEEDGDDEKDEADEQMELPKPKRRKSRPAA